MEVLPKIKGPEDLKDLDEREMETLAAEIREAIVEVVSKNGGHLSSNLGVVELTLALHRVFDFSRDRIVWDVGHQCYPHKLLTGRYSEFATLRQENGISGFPRRAESVFDHFDTGHAGTSISAALGFATARDLAGEDTDVLAVIGDGSMTSGLALEGLNNAGAHNTDIIVILNDNEMSISPNVGALSQHLNRIISGEMYNRMRDDVDRILARIPALGKQMSSLAHRLEEAVKGIIVPGRLFEDLGFHYFGPIDGHKLPFLLETLESVKRLKGPRLIHVVTKKGHGYRHAEDRPGEFHGTGPFNIETGKSVAAKKTSWTGIFGKTMLELAETEEKLVAITAAMLDGTGLVEFRERFPERLFDVGIAEQHAVTFAGALAAEGYRPVVAIYSTFLQRAFDQVIHDVCNMNLPVTFAIDRAGIVGDDGSTHQGAFDISYLRLIPNMTVMAPKDENELRHMLYTSISHGGPCAIRYPRGAAVGVPLEQEFHGMDIGRAELVKEGNDVLIAALGSRVYDALLAAEKLEKDGVSVAVINARFAKPIDAELISAWAKRCGVVVTVEENAIAGGFGSAVFDELRNAGLGSIAGISLGIPDVFVQHAPQETSRKKYFLDPAGIYSQTKKLLESPESLKAVIRDIRETSRRTLQ